MKQIINEIKKDAPINLTLSRICVQVFKSWLHALIKKSNELNVLELKRLELAVNKSSKYVIDLNNIPPEWQIDNQSKKINTKQLFTRNTKRNNINNVIIKFQISPIQTDIEGSFIPSEKKEERNMNLRLLIGKELFSVENNQLKINKQPFLHIVKKIKELIAHEVTHSSQIFNPQEAQQKLNNENKKIKSIVMFPNGAIKEEEVPFYYFKNGGTLINNHGHFIGVLFPNKKTIQKIIDYSYGYYNDPIEIEAYTKEYLEGSKFDKNINDLKNISKEQLFLSNMENHVIHTFTEMIKNQIENLKFSLNIIKINKLTDSPNFGVNKLMFGTTDLMEEFDKIFLDFIENCCNYAVTNFKLKINIKHLANLTTKLQLIFDNISKKEFEKAVIGEKQNQQTPQNKPKKRMLEID